MTGASERALRRPVQAADTGIIVAFPVINALEIYISWRYHKTVGQSGVNRIMHLTLHTSDITLVDELRKFESSNKHLQIQRSRMSRQSLTGEEVAEFLALSIASGVAYDVARNVIMSVFQMIKSRVSSKNSKDIEIMIDGVSYDIRNQSDLNRIIKAILSKLEIDNDNESST